jgi:ACS family hexuronate transporter-like MFS transporter
MGMQRSLRLRWWIFGLLLLLNLVNNFDRQVFALVAPTLQQEFGWGEVAYGRMVAAFQVTFAVMNLGCGRLVDAIGVRLSMALAITWFSVAQLAHALARTTFGFALARVGLAVGEAPVYPASLKGLAEWAPQGERAFAAGLVHFGVMIGAIVAPLTIPWMTVHWGWQSGFLMTGIMGLLLVVPWLVIYRHPEQHRWLSASERELIAANRHPPAAQPGLRWRQLFRHRELWVYVAIQAIVNPAWWFLVYWLPKFLGEAYGIRGVAVTPYITTVYCMAAVGALAGGSLSGLLLKRRMSSNAARKLTMLLCGLVMPCVIIAAYTRSAWLAVTVIGIAAVVHQTWTATGAAVLADLFPTRAVASVAGIASFVGSLVGVAAAEATGHFLAAHPGNYAPMFVYAGFAYLVAVGVIHWLSPRLEPVRGI